MNSDSIAKPEVFISYASHDVDRLTPIALELQGAGVTIWRDKDQILGGENYGPRIVDAIRSSKVLLLICSAASMRSRNVKQEIAIAWSYGRPYLPLLLDNSAVKGFPEQVKYWLEGSQWIEVMDHPAGEWLPRVLASLASVGVKSASLVAATPSSVVRPIPPLQGLQGLRQLARFTDQIWPLPADRIHRGAMRFSLRDLGAPQDDLQHAHRLGSRVCLAIESDRAGHLLLLDEGPSGKIYCLCPSIFAPDTQLSASRHYLPQEKSRYDAFVVSGEVGREHLLAIISDEVLGFDWMPTDPLIPARVVSPSDIEELLDRLRGLPGDQWRALSTYFDVVS